jgi:hypothetical protein
MYDRQALSALIPAGVRRRDRGEDGSPLNARLRAIASQVERVEADLAQLYDAWFIETATPWVVPYINPLLSPRLRTMGCCHPVPSRVEAAGTLGRHRCSGPPSVLDQPRALPGLDSAGSDPTRKARINTVAGCLHDVGLAAWFGGSLMAAFSANKSLAAVTSPDQRLPVANAAWAAWAPVNLGAIVIHGIGGAMLVANNNGRLTGQRGVAASTIVKTALTAGALAATGYSRILGQRVLNADDMSVADGVTPASETPSDVASAQRQLKLLQYAIPGLLGLLLIANARVWRAPPT